MDKTIFTLEARGNAFLEVMTESMALSDEVIHDEIDALFNNCQLALKQQGINYEDLKNCLIPRKDRQEIAFVFDSMQTGSDMYGYHILSRLFTLFDPKSTNSILA